ncbi:hypothetical protein ACNA06_22400 [Lysinibacillus sp. RSDA_15]|uniref:hypothetical protein n=1 Tax=Lysinibacillus TaxID=400634 RepID=UPI001F507770|nr:hypothetical protein [Lysinibacillus sphaericus]
MEIEVSIDKFVIDFRDVPHSVAPSVLGVKEVQNRLVDLNTNPNNNLQNSVNYGSRFLPKQINPFEDKHIIDKVAEARGELSKKYKEQGNFAYAKMEVSGIDKKDFYDHSGIHDPS